MGRIVIKEARDVEFYVEWSSVVEAPTFAGSRSDMLAHLRKDSDPFLREDAPHRPERRLERCDRTGTTSLWVEAAGMRDRYAEEGAWDDDSFIYKQRGVVNRRDVFTLARRVFADPDADVSDLMWPFEDDHADGGVTIRPAVVAELRGPMGETG